MKNPFDYFDPYVSSMETVHSFQVQTQFEINVQ